MAAPLYKFNDRRGQSRAPYSARSNNLYPAATQTQDRKAIPYLDYDTERNITRAGHRQLRSAGKALWGSFPVIRGALLEQAELSASHFIPQHVGRNKDWGLEAEAWLKEWHKIMDVRGWPYDATTYCINLILYARREGDILTLLTENEDGYPLIQTVGPHRVGSDYESSRIEGGTFSGANICKGVISDVYGRTIGYRIYQDDYLSGDYVDVSARDAFLSGFPEWCDQSRFISSIGACAFDWQDVSERRAFEMLAQKIGSAISLIEKNEAGEAPNTGTDHVVFPEDGVSTAATPSGLVVEKYDGGMIRYIRPNESVEAPRFDRPSADSQRFEETIVRGAFKGMEWDVDFSLDPSKVGGASMRVVVEKINRTIEKNQRLIEKAMRRIDGYALSKAIKLGLLPDDPDWWKWEYQGPSRVTADAKYDDDIDRERLKMGGLTYRDWYAKRGMWWEDEVRQRIAEQKFIEAECIVAGVDINKVQQMTPNGTPEASEQRPDETEKEAARK
jgi:hypothetical protein